MTPSPRAESDRDQFGNLRKLPAEIRAIIYCHLVGPEISLQASPRGVFHPAILRVNSAIHKEASNVLYGYNGIIRISSNCKVLYEHTSEDAGPDIYMIPSNKNYPKGMDTTQLSCHANLRLRIEFPWRENVDYKDINLDDGTQMSQQLHQVYGQHTRQGRNARTGKEQEFFLFLPDLDFFTSIVRQIDLSTVWRCDLQDPAFYGAINYDILVFPTKQGTHPHTTALQELLEPFKRLSGVDQRVVVSGAVSSLYASYIKSEMCPPLSSLDSPRWDWPTNNTTIYGMASTGKRNADNAFRQGDYELAETLYESVQSFLERAMKFSQSLRLGRAYQQIVEQSLAYLEMIVHCNLTLISLKTDGELGECTLFSDGRAQRLSDHPFATDQDRNLILLYSALKYLDTGKLSRAQAEIENMTGLYARLPHTDSTGWPELVNLLKHSKNTTACAAWRPDRFAERMHPRQFVGDYRRLQAVVDSLIEYAQIVLDISGPEVMVSVENNVDMIIKTSDCLVQELPNEPWEARINVPQ
ncbi:hypothetical protein LTS18_015087 [Coniosporium uncinatum]|uniref:Uncharacterized protein n=1 Tax=Coniosporium uncinatum TaxID=93489 RepID=A0ACC3D8Q2_9PEZI|nr:hypothetical protein LTS18_015087 [Coniosporium uncinatum]